MSTVLTEPGIAALACLITSTDPKWAAAAMPAACRVGEPEMTSMWFADPNWALGDGGASDANAIAKVAAATESVRSPITASCCRHSRRNSRQAQRTTARRAGAPPDSRCAADGRERTDALTADVPALAVTQDPPAAT